MKELIAFIPPLLQARDYFSNPNISSENWQHAQEIVITFVQKFWALKFENYFCTLQLDSFLMKLAWDGK